MTLELQRGCRNDAVLDGFAAYLIRWCTESARAAEPDLQRRLERIAGAFEGYEALSPSDRRELCEKTIKALQLYRKRFDAQISPQSEVRFLRGVGPRRAEVLAELGIRTIHDLLRHYPLRYDDRRNVPPIASLEHRQTASVQVTVTGPGRVKRPPGRVLVEVPATDGATPVSLVWFNQPYRAQQFGEGTTLLVTGQVMIRKGEFSITVAEVEVLGQPPQESPAPDTSPTAASGPQARDDQALSTARITPIYPLTSGVSQTMLRRLISEALETCDPLPESAAPEALAEARDLMPLPEAFRQIHFPTDNNAQRAARARIAYEELFALQAVLALRKRSAQETNEDAIVPTSQLAEQFAQALPFEPTAAQRRVVTEIAADLERPQPANRLIHGDVGSGKTVCAAFALLAAAQAGKQAAIMAPTELLATQHHRVVGDLLAPFGIRCRLLIGSMGEAAKRHARQQIERGEDRVIVGTHALFQESVQFRDLAVVVTDEQHRFGVRQRAELSAKGLCPNVFVMSATPIPRTLALTAYGDFDVSVLDELPPGRTPVLTTLAWGKDRLRAYETLVHRVVAGRQAYVVCPLIEEGEEGRLAAAEHEFHRLRHGHFASFELGLLHGKLDSDQRETTMKRFRDGEIEILVATTVIEVGVDVPNATVMLIENAERFGLAQLHQLRGRVGRGEHDAICMMLTRAKSPDVIDRLQVLERTNDGFEIAEEDLRRRGPGELTGTRQSGLPDLRMADLVADTQTLMRAREDAFAIIEADPNLEAPQHAALRKALLQFETDEHKWAM